MIIVNILVIIFLCFVLVKASDILVINLKAICDQTKIASYVFTNLVVALATSLPELFVGIAAAIRSESSLSLGNIVGANIANLSLVIGGAALVGGVLQVRGKFLKSDAFYAFLAGASPLLLLLDHHLSRLDGLILLSLYGFYQFVIISEQSNHRGESSPESGIKCLVRNLNHRQTKKELGWVLLGIALLLLSSDLIVRQASQIASSLQIPVLLVGLVLISIGTTLPELVFDIEAIKKHQPQMVYGNLLGSIAANSTLIIGLVALISPVQIKMLSDYLIATMGFVFVFGVFYLFVRTKHRLDRWEGMLLIGLYLLFAALEFIYR